MRSPFSALGFSGLYPTFNETITLSLLASMATLTYGGRFLALLPIAFIPAGLRVKVSFGAGYIC